MTLIFKVSIKICANSILRENILTFDVFISLNFVFLRLFYFFRVIFFIAWRKRSDRLRWSGLLLFAFLSSILLRLIRLWNFFWGGARGVFGGACRRNTSFRVKNFLQNFDTFVALLLDLFVGIWFVSSWIILFSGINIFWGIWLILAILVRWFHFNIFWFNLFFILRGIFLGGSSVLIIFVLLLVFTHVFW